MQTELDYLRQKVPFLENIIASLETEKAEWYHQKMQFETKIAELNKIIDNLVLKNKAFKKNVAEKQSQLNDIDINSMLDVDFDRNFDADPAAINSFDQGGSDSSSQGVTKQKKRRKKPEPQAWEQNVNKKMREEGKAYKGKVKVDGKWQYQAERRARQLQPPCQCKMSENSKGKLWCNKFTEEHRKYIFDMFWSKSWEEKRKAVQTYVRVDEPSDCRNRKNEISRRKNTFFYHLPDETGTLRPVCKNQFWNTLDIRGHMVAKMIEKQDEEVEPEQEDTPKDNMSEKRKIIIKFLSLLPKMECHYPEMDPLKTYLDPTYSTKVELYKIYKQQYNPPLRASHTLFFSVMKEMGISIFHSNEDQNSSEQKKTKKNAKTLINNNIKQEENLCYYNLG